MDKAIVGSIRALLVPYLVVNCIIINIYYRYHSIQAISRLAKFTGGEIYQG